MSFPFLHTFRKGIFRYPELLFLVSVSFLTRFWNLSYPEKVVFDEAHFGLYATKYFSHQFYFDIHPPLGKMLLALAGWVGGGVTQGFNFAVGTPYENINFLALRFVPALLGALLIPLVYLLVRELNFSRRAAFTAGFFVLFDNAFLVQSRLILLDIVLVFFIILSLFLFLLSQKAKIFSRKWFFLSFLSGLALGSALSIKWIGMGALAFVWTILLFQKDILRQSKKYVLSHAGFFLLFPLAVYITIFGIHLSLIPNSCEENCGAVLEKGDPDQFKIFNTPSEGNFVKKFLQQNLYMAYGTIGAGPSSFYYSSPWYSWPFLIRPVLYDSSLQSQEGRVGRIFFLGNPVVWYLSLGGVLGTLYLLGRWVLYRFRFSLPKAFDLEKIFFLFAGYFIFLLPFASIVRFTVLYHYLTALIFAIVFLAVFLEGILSYFSRKKAMVIYAGILFAVILSFLYFSPLSYGIPLSEHEFQARMWLPTWDL